MSLPSWRSSLAELLARRRKPDGPARLAIVGIGSELRGDDAAGVAVARELEFRLKEKAGDPGRSPVLVIDAGPSPENSTGPLRRFVPDLVLLIDAAAMGEAPGTIRLLNWQQAEGFSASTHTFGLDMLAQYLISELGGELALLGIQPADASFVAAVPSTQSSSPAAALPLSPRVRTAVQEIVEDIVELLRV